MKDFLGASIQKKMLILYNKYRYLYIGTFLLCTIKNLHSLVISLNQGPLEWRLESYSLNHKERERVISVHDKFIVFVFLWDIEISWVFISERIRIIVPEIRMV